MLFQIPTIPEPRHEFTLEEDMNIYSSQKKGVSHLELRQTINYPNTYEESLKISAEIQRIENEVISKMNGTFITSPKVFNDLELISGEEYYSVTTKQDLIDSIDSFLDVEIVLNDIIIYHNNYDPSRTWTQFKESF